MLDLRAIRSDPDVARQGLIRRGDDPGVIDEVLELDRLQRALGSKRDDLRNQVKTLSKEVGQLRRDGRDDEAQVKQDESRALGSDEKAKAAEAAELSECIRSVLLTVPNLPAADAPDGADESDNVVSRVEGFDPDAYGEHQRVPHWDIGAELGVLDLERGTKISGSMFVMYRGAGAALVRSLCQVALDRNRDLYEEVRPPTLVLTDTMVSTGHLPKFVDEAYHIERDDLWAIPTAEVPLTSLARDEILDEADLPARFMAHTSCFRREAGSAGRDTRGLLRVHEFDKVELLAYGRPQDAAAQHAEIMQRAESLIADLGLAYRVLDLCTGDLGASAARTWDIEVYAPGVDQWLEVSSVSWFTDYQARRANVRYRPDGGKPTFVHTFNGSALAVPRVWAALVEVGRQPDGSVLIPEILQPYLGGADRIPGPR